VRHSLLCQPLLQRQTLAKLWLWGRRWLSELLSLKQLASLPAKQ
jgi:hypothetical protein